MFLFFLIHLISLFLKRKCVEAQPGSALQRNSSIESGYSLDRMLLSMSAVLPSNIKSLSVVQYFFGTHSLKCSKPWSKKNAVMFFKHPAVHQVAGHHPSAFSGSPLTFSPLLLSAGIVALTIYSLHFTKHVLHNCHITLARKANEGDDENISLYWVSCGSLRCSHFLLTFRKCPLCSALLELNGLIGPGPGKPQPVKDHCFQGHVTKELVT